MSTLHEDAAAVAAATPEEIERVRRLSYDELFRVGPGGLEEISDDTLRMRVFQGPVTER